jgi:hypothetical protein
MDRGTPVTTNPRDISMHIEAATAALGDGAVFVAGTDGRGLGDWAAHPRVRVTLASCHDRGISKRQIAAVPADATVVVALPFMGHPSFYAVRDETERLGRYFVPGVWTQGQVRRLLAALLEPMTITGRRPSQPELQRLPTRPVVRSATVADAALRFDYAAFEAHLVDEFGPTKKRQTVERPANALAAAFKKAGLV